MLLLRGGGVAGKTLLSSEQIYEKSKTEEKLKPVFVGSKTVSIQYRTIDFVDRAGRFWMADTLFTSLHVSQAFTCLKKLV